MKDSTLSEKSIIGIKDHIRDVRNVVCRVYDYTESGKNKVDLIAVLYSNEVSLESYYTYPAVLEGIYGSFLIFGMDSKEDALLFILKHGGHYIHYDY